MILENLNDMNDSITTKAKIDQLEKEEFEYRVISEDIDTVTVFLRLKPGQQKEAQKNVAGPMVFISYIID